MRLKVYPLMWMGSLNELIWLMCCSGDTVHSSDGTCLPGAALSLSCDRRFSPETLRCDAHRWFTAPSISGGFPILLPTHCP